MENLSNQRVYLTPVGAGRIFANPALVGLPVVVTAPKEISGRIMYQDMYAIVDGTFVCGISSNDDITDLIPSGVEQQAAEVAYQKHVDELVRFYGPGISYFIDIQTLLDSKPDPVMVDDKPIIVEN